MKLKSKLTLGVITTLLIALVACCSISIHVCKNSILENTEHIVTVELQKLKDNLEKNWQNIEMNRDDLTEQVMLKYFFFQQTKYADENTEYVLLKPDGEAIYNDSGIDPVHILDLNAETELHMETVHLMEQDYIICGVRFYGEGYQVYLVRNITSVYQQVSRLTGICVALSLLVSIFAGVFLVLFLQKVLHPLEQMQNEAEAIAKGDYGARLNRTGRDELANLAQSFDRMAESVQQHISEVEELSDARNRLIHALSHEMRTPITAISGYAYALRSVKMNEEQRAESLEFMEEEAKRLARLSGKLNDLVGLSGRKLELCKISLSSMKRQLEMIYQEQEDVILKVEDGTIAGDQDLLIMLITNLSDNAKKAGATEVIIQVTPKVICVSDNGAGMTEEVKTHIFEAFYQGDRSHNQEGFGLGLALCQKIAELHGTKLQVSSQLGKGSAFYLYNSFTSH